MAVIRRLVNQSYNDVQPLRVDHASRFIVNNDEHWQMMFNLNSELTNSLNMVKIAAELNTTTLSSIRFIGYLWDNIKNSVNQAATCSFNIYTVTQPSWNEVLVHSIMGVEQSNSYHLSDISFDDLGIAELDGDSTLMIEVVLVRLGKQYRERVYINHLGVYDSVIKLRQDIEYLDITKLDE